MQSFVAPGTILAAVPLKRPCLLFLPTINNATVFRKQWSRGAKTDAFRRFRFRKQQKAH